MTTRGQKYYPMKDSWVNEHASDLLIMEGHGWTFDHTGGGCTAVSLIFEDKFELMATDSDCNVPCSKRRDDDWTDDEMVCMCLYALPDGSSGGEPLHYRYMSWKTFISKKATEWLDDFRKACNV